MLTPPQHSCQILKENTGGTIWSTLGKAGNHLLSGCLEACEAAKHGERGRPSISGGKGGLGEAETQQ